MYIIHRGRVTEHDEAMAVAVKDYVPGQHFGLINGLTRDFPFTFTYRTCRKSEILTLQLDTWEHLLHLFPKSKYEVYKNVPNHLSKSSDDHGVPREPKHTALAAAGGSPWHMHSGDDDHASSVAADTEKLSTISSGSSRVSEGKQEDAKEDTDEIYSELEEAPQRRTTFLRRLTLQAKKIIGKESFDQEHITSKDILKYENAGTDKDTLLLDEDIKVTSALLERFERKARKSVAEGFLEKTGLEIVSHEQTDALNKLILAQYIDKKEAENAEKAFFTHKKSLAIRDYTEDDENEVSSVSKAPRRSVVMFGDDKDKPIRIIPPPETKGENQATAPLRSSRRSIVILGGKDVRKTNETEDEKHNDNDKETQQIIMAPRRSILVSREPKPLTERESSPVVERGKVFSNESENQKEDDTRMQLPLLLKSEDDFTTILKSESAEASMISQFITDKNKVLSSEWNKDTRDITDIEANKIPTVSTFKKIKEENREEEQTEGIFHKDILQNAIKTDNNEVLEKKKEKDKTESSQQESRRPKLPIFIETDKDDKLEHEFKFNESFPFPIHSRMSYDYNKFDSKDEKNTSTIDDALKAVEKESECDNDIDTLLLRGPSRAILNHKSPEERKEDEPKKQMAARRISMISPPDDDDEGLALNKKNEQSHLMHKKLSYEHDNAKLQKPKPLRRISVFIPPADEDIIEKGEMEEEQRIQEQELEFKMLNRRASRRISVFAPPRKDQSNQDILEELDEPIEPLAGSSRQDTLYKRYDDKVKRKKKAILGKKRSDTKSVHVSNSQESIEGYYESKSDKKRTIKKNQIEKTFSRVRYEGDEYEEFSLPQSLIDQRRSTAPTPLQLQQRAFSEVIGPTSTLTREERNAIMMDSDLDPNILPEVNKKPYNKKFPPKKK